MKAIKNLFRITPFKLSLVIVLIFVGSSIVYDINPLSLPFMSSFDQKSLDVKFLIRGPQAPKSKIVLVAGDEKSFQEYGQWPWSRANVQAAIIEKLCSLNPKAIGLDIFWVDHEKTIPENVRQTLADALPGKGKELDELLTKSSGDPVLGKVIENCISKVVLGYSLSTRPEEGLPPDEFKKRFDLMVKKGGNTLSSIVKGKAIYAQEPGGDDKSNVSFYQGAKTGLLNIPEVAPLGVAQGFVSNETDSDGNYRHALLFYRVDDEFVPSVPLRMAQKALTQADSPPSLLVQPSLPEKGQAEDLKLGIDTVNGTQNIPIDFTGQAIVNYRGPNKTFTNISVADLLSPSETVEYDVYDPAIHGMKNVKQHKTEIFKDALVIIGLTAIGIYDIRPRPFDSQAAGAENHASILDNIMNNDFLVRPTTELLLILNIGLLIVSLLYGWVINKLDSKLGALFAAVCITGLLVADQKFLFNRGIVFAGHLQAIQFLFQYLAITVLKYMKEEKDKKHIRSAFDKYVSPAIINEMLSDPSKLQLGGQKKKLTILFSDIRGFTTLSEKLDVKTLTLFLNEYLGAMTEILQNSKGTLDKYIGDALMGFWGAPIDVESNAQCAVKAASDMMIKLADLNKQFKTKYDITIDIGIGINTGEVSVGNFGSSKVFEYTVIGDNVNLASRLEGLNKYYGTHIIVSEATRETLVEDGFFVREIDRVKVKGKEKPVKIFEVVPDTPENAALKASLALFNTALGDYYEQKWDGSIQKLTEFRVKNAGDKVSSELIERCEHFMKNSPGTDWDGSWEMHSK